MNNYALIANEIICNYKTATKTEIEEFIDIISKFDISDKDINIFSELYSIKDNSNVLNALLEIINNDELSLDKKSINFIISFFNENREIKNYDEDINYINLIKFINKLYINYKSIKNISKIDIIYNHDILSLYNLFESHKDEISKLDDVDELFIMILQHIKNDVSYTKIKYLVELAIQ